VREHIAANHNGDQTGDLGDGSGEEVLERRESVSKGDPLDWARAVTGRTSAAIQKMPFALSNLCIR
jgi:hypothetical protein